MADEINATIEDQTTVLDRLAAAAERIAEAMEEENRWAWTESPDGDSYRTCRVCAKTWQANTTGWLECVKSHPGCPRCREKESSDGEE